MKNIRNLTEEDRSEIFRLLKPIGYKESDDLHTCEILGHEDGSVELKPVNEEE